MSDLSPSDDELGSAVNVTYTPRVIKFIDRGEQDALQSMLCKRRMKFDVARTPMLDCLYDADGSTLLHELIKAGNSLPIHPWETADMRAFRMRGDLASVQLADVISFHAKFRRPSSVRLCLCGSWPFWAGDARSSPHRRNRPLAWFTSSLFP